MKKPIENILEESKKIDITASAKEVLTWIANNANNVEQFIDNQRRMFKLDLIIDGDDSGAMASIRKLQDLYRAIPEDPTPNVEVDSNNFSDLESMLTDEEKSLLQEIQKCRSELDEVSKKIFQAMKDETDLLEKIFNIMGFYYELQGINEGRLLLEEVAGEVDIIKFEYESFPIGVSVFAPVINTIDEETGEITKEGGEVIKRYTIPEGFTVWLEIAFKSKKEK